MPVAVTVGDRVLLPEYGGTKVSVDDKVSYFATCSHKRILLSISGKKPIQ